MFFENKLNGVYNFAVNYQFPLVKFATKSAAKLIVTLAVVLLLWFAWITWDSVYLLSHYPRKPRKAKKLLLPHAVLQKRFGNVNTV